jgi:hypothetical protein
MAKTKISEFDSTPANNTDIDSINIAEGCAPSGINNAIRELMSQLKDQQTGASGDNFTVGGNLVVTGTSVHTGATTFTGAVVLSTSLPVASGGTGASTAGNARTNLSAAASGTNSDITSLTGLTTPLTVAQGGTGAATLTANNVILGNGTSAPSFVAPSTNGNVLTSNGTTWVSQASSSGGVTSAIAGNGIAVSGATGAVTFSVACPTFNTVGSYAGAGSDSVTGFNLTAGSNYSVGSGNGQMRSGAVASDGTNGFYPLTNNNLSGTWKWMSATYSTPSGTGTTYIIGVACRVS